ncbi:MAG: fructosamine kinase family protein [Actinobacteria bacterium]|nr:fructosamine kinase family protein [Actinomycetota bacterium]
MPDRFTKRTAPGAALYEASGLRWLAAVPGGAPVVEVVSASEREIVLERLVPAAPTREAAAELGRRLAVTHDAGAPAFGAPPKGWDGDGWIGTEPMSLHPSDSWGRFYAEQRCLPYARRAHARGGLDREGLSVVDKACTRIADGVYDDEAPPARIHGDLWSGNVFATARGFVLIDPAAHGGHRLADLAMLALFGAPYLDVIQEAYETATRWLPTGWGALLGLHQLHPLLVHAAIFGGGYGDRAASVARRLL